MHMDSKTQSKRQPIFRHLRFWTCKDSKSRRVLEQIATLCPPFRGSRSFLSVLGKQFFHSNMSWTGWHIWWHWKRGKMSAKLSVFRISAAPGSSEWTQWHWLEGKLVHDKDISVSAPDCCQSKENHLRGKFQQGKICWNLNCRKYVARTRSWLLTKPLLVSFTPKIFRLRIQATKFEQPACSGENFVGFLVSKWMRQNIAGRLASVLLFLIHFTNGFIAISSKWFSKMAK